MSRTFSVFCDGGARGNPGPAGVGIVIYRGEEELLGAGAYLGETTNNVAEYCGLIWALENAEALGARKVELYADSSLMIKQLNGEFKVKDTKLKRLHARAHDLIARFESCKMSHVFREDNARADELANDAMDRRDDVGNYQIDATGVRQFVEDVHATLFDTPPSPDACGGTSPAPYRQEAGTGMYSLQVKWHFDAAHHLYGYPGECAELHGHTWEVEVTVESEKLNDIEIVYDFKDLKADLKHIVDVYDHKHLNDIPPFDVISPTAENLARVIFEELTKSIGTKVKVAEVAVWESPVARVGYRITP